MEIEIKNRFTGTIIISEKTNSLKSAIEKHKADLEEADLREADLWGADLEGANLREADLREADLWEADLREADLWGADLEGADLRGANLREADLRGANLREADLWGADLRGANLWGANLWGAKNLPAIFKSNLNILKFQKSPLTAFKYLNGNKSPYKSFQYEVGKTYQSDDFNSDERILCDKGFNVASLDWCLRDTDCDLTKSYIEVEFQPEDIVAIPYNSDGKFRVKKLKVIRKLTKKELKKAIKPLYPE